MVGARAAIIENISSDVTVVGIPGKIIKKHGVVS